MTEDIANQEEFALQAMFGRTILPVADQGFSKTVAGRLRRGIWRRRLVLLPAAVIGLVMALPVIPQFLLALSDELVGLAASAEKSDAMGQFGVLLTVLPLREAAQAASEDIAQVSAQLGTVSWYLQNQVYILAGLMATISLVAIRVLGR